MAGDPRMYTRVLDDESPRKREKGSNNFNCIETNEF